MPIIHTMENPNICRTVPEANGNPSSTYEEVGYYGLGEHYENYPDSDSNSNLDDSEVTNSRCNSKHRQPQSEAMEFKFLSFECLLRIGTYLAAVAGIPFMFALVFTRIALALGKENTLGWFTWSFIPVMLAFHCHQNGFAERLLSFCKLVGHMQDTRIELELENAALKHQNANLLASQARANSETSDALQQLSKLKQKLADEQRARDRENANHKATLRSLKESRSDYHVLNDCMIKAEKLAREESRRKAVEYNAHIKTFEEDRVRLAGMDSLEKALKEAQKDAADCKTRVSQLDLQVAEEKATNDALRDLIDKHHCDTASHSQEESSIITSGDPHATSIPERMIPRTITEPTGSAQSIEGESDAIVRSGEIGSNNLSIDTHPSSYKSDDNFTRGMNLNRNSSEQEPDLFDIITRGNTKGNKSCQVRAGCSDIQTNLTPNPQWNEQDTQLVIFENDSDQSATALPIDEPRHKGKSVARIQPNIAAMPLQPALENSEYDPSYPLFDPSALGQIFATFSSSAGGHGSPIQTDMDIIFAISMNSFPTERSPEEEERLENHLKRLVDRINLADSNREVFFSKLYESLEALQFQYFGRPSLRCIVEACLARYSCYLRFDADESKSEIRDENKYLEHFDDPFGQNGSDSQGVGAAGINIDATNVSQWASYSSNESPKRSNATSTSSSARRPNRVKHLGGIKKTSPRGPNATSPNQISRLQEERTPQDLINVIADGSATVTAGIPGGVDQPWQTDDMQVDAITRLRRFQEYLFGPGDPPQEEDFEEEL
ncbi:MAG: hypothetical protein M1835_005620 [Candelina submexicana]|nr:MAG: hypothetical protein M1835_005620 [Candelina submexicana]